MQDVNLSDSRGRHQGEGVRVRAVQQPERPARGAHPHERLRRTQREQATNQGLIA